MEQYQPQSQIQSQTRPSFYCNISQIEASVFDVILNLGTKKDRNVVEVKTEDFDVSIIMSIHHAKALCAVLGETLRQYEEKFGVLNIEPKKVE